MSSIEDPRASAEHTVGDKIIAVGGEISTIALAIAALHRAIDQTAQRTERLCSESSYRTVGIERSVQAVRNEVRYEKVEDVVIETIDLLRKQADEIQCVVSDLRKQGATLSKQTATANLRFEAFADNVNQIIELKQKLTLIQGEMRTLSDLKPEIEDLRISFLHLIEDRDQRTVNVVCAGQQEIDGRLVMLTARFDQMEKSVARVERQLSTLTNLPAFVKAVLKRIWWRLKGSPR